MPRTIRCRTCKKVILRIKHSASKEKILSAIRNHYQKYHPSNIALRFIVEKDLHSEFLEWKKNKVKKYE